MVILRAEFARHREEVVSWLAASVGVIKVLVRISLHPVVLPMHYLWLLVLSHLSRRLLNALTVSASFTSSGSAFQSFVTLIVKNCFRHSSLVCPILIMFVLDSICPSSVTDVVDRVLRVLPSVFISNHSFLSTLLIPKEKETGGKRKQVQFGQRCVQTV